MGQAALSTPGGRAQAWRGGGTDGGAHLRRAGRGVSDAVRIFERELAPPSRGGVVPDATLRGSARAGGREAPRKRRPVQDDRGSRAVRTQAEAPAARG